MDIQKELAAIDKQERIMEGLKDKLTNPENYTQDDIKRIKEEMKALRSKRSVLDNQRRDLRLTIDTMANNASKLTAERLELEDSVTILEDELSQVQADLIAILDGPDADHKVHISNPMKAKVGELKAKIEATDLQIAGISTQLNLKNQKESRLAHLDAQVDSLKAEYDALAAQSDPKTFQLNLATNAVARDRYLRDYERLYGLSAALDLRKAILDAVQNNHPFVVYPKDVVPVEEVDKVLEENAFANPIPVMPFVASEPSDVVGLANDGTLVLASDVKEPVAAEDYSLAASEPGLPNLPIFGELDTTPDELEEAAPIAAPFTLPEVTPVLGQQSAEDMLADMEARIAARRAATQAPVEEDTPDLDESPVRRAYTVIGPITDPKPVEAKPAQETPMSAADRFFAQEQDEPVERQEVTGLRDLEDDEQETLMEKFRNSTLFKTIAAVGLAAAVLAALLLGPKACTPTPVVDDERDQAGTESTMTPSMTPTESVIPSSTIVITSEMIDEAMKGKIVTATPVPTASNSGNGGGTSAGSGTSNGGGSHGGGSHGGGSHGGGQSENSGNDTVIDDQPIQDDGTTPGYDPDAPIVPPYTPIEIPDPPLPHVPETPVVEEKTTQEQPANNIIFTDPTLEQGGKSR